MYATIDIVVKQLLQKLLLEPCATTFSLFYFECPKQGIYCDFLVCLGQLAFKRIKFKKHIDISIIVTLP
jgi:hypothetical protein